MDLVAQVLPGYPDVGNRCGKENEHHDDLPTPPEAVLQIFEGSGHGQKHSSGTT